MPKRAVIAKPKHRAVLHPGDVFLQTDLSGKIISSEGLFHIIGKNDHQLIGKLFKDLISKGGQPGLSQLLRKKKIAKTTLELSLKAKPKNLLIQFTVEPKSGRGKEQLLTWSGKIKPAATSKELATAIKIFDKNPQPVLIYNPNDLSVVYSNPAATKLYGQQFEAFNSISFNELLTGGMTEQKETLAGKGSWIHSFVKEGGEKVLLDVFTTSVEIDKKAYKVAFANPSSTAPANNKTSDIEAKVREELKGAYDDVHEILQNAPEIIYKLDGQGNFIFVSKEFEVVLGYSNEEIIGQHFSVIIHPDDKEVVDQGFADIFQFGRAKSSIVFRAVKKAGGMDWFSTSGVFIFDKDGTPTYCIGFAQNVTQFKEVLHQLEASEERYTAFIKHASEGIWRFETGTPIDTKLPEDELVTQFINSAYLAECNDKMAQLYGFEQASDLVGAQLNQFVSTEDPASVQYFQGFIQSGFNLVDCETHETDKDGNQKVFLNNLVGIIQDEKLVRVWGTQRDITQQRMAEENIRRLANLVDNTSDIVISQNLQLEITSWNKAAENIFGVTAADAIGKKFLELVKVEFLSGSMEESMMAFTQQSTWTGEIVYTTSSGEKIYILCTVNSLQDTEGKPIGVFFIGKDISATKKAQEQLEQSENFFKTLISDSLDGIIVINNEGVVTYAAASITNVLGYLPEEVIGTNCFEFVHVGDRPTALQGFSNEMQRLKKRYLEIRFKSKKGEWLWMLVRAHNLFHQPAVNGMVVHFTNITQRKHTENKLKESEKRFRTLADTAPVMIWVADELNRSTYVSKCWMDFTGINLDEINKKGWKSVVHPEDHAIAIDQYNQHFKQRMPVDIEYRVRAYDGSFKWVIDHGVPRFSPDGTFMGYIGSVIDIHDRKTAEQKLRYQARMIENIRDAVISTDLDFNIISLNTMAEEMYRFKKEEVLGRNIRDLIHHEYLSISRENVLIQLYQKEVWEGEVYFDRVDGKRIFLYLTLSFVTNEKGERIGLVGIHRDITERYEAEKALRISEERYRSVVDALTEGIILQNNKGNIIACNKSAESILGDAEMLIGTKFRDQEWLCIKEDGTRFQPDEDPTTLTLLTGKSFQGVVMGIQKPGQMLHWFAVNAEPIYYSDDRLLPDAVVTSFVDITQRKHQEQLLKLEKDVLAINAKPSATLKSTVDFYLEGIEKIFPDMICSILMLSDDGESIQHLSAPSLPVEYSNAVDGVKIGPKVGSCGTAMYTKSKVITIDINQDPLWEDFRPLANQFGLESCWSFPIINAQSDVLATIAAYHKYPKAPSDKELTIMEVACNLLQIIIESKRTETNLRVSNERYLLATKATHDAIYDWDFIRNKVTWGENFYSLFNFKRNTAGYDLEFWESRLHPEDRQRVTTNIKDYIEKKSSKIWEIEYRFRNGADEFVIVYDRGFLLFNQEGEITRMVGSMMDITERKELERKVMKQEIERQKIIAQAVIDAQEKERGEIGKELHDNVNQILSTARLYLELARSDENERLNMIKRSYDNIYDAIQEIRSISRSLVPPSIGDLGIIESIHDLVENIRGTKKINLEFYHSGPELDAQIGTKQKLMLFRIIQEQVTNVLKHAEAKKIIIELILDDNMVNLAVSDDGKGFDLEKIRNKGVGLQNMSSRTELFNGKLTIVTSPGNGCKLNIHVPISKL